RPSATGGKGREPLSACCALLFLLLAALTGQAQPSGGPYGPIQQTYDLPRNAAHIFYVAPEGQSNAPGTTLDNPTTLEAAVERVVTGDAIIMRGGTYRTGGLQFNQGMTLQPYADEHPVLKGTLVATNWVAQTNGLWRTAWSHLFPAKAADWWRREREGTNTPPWRFNNDMVFVDGELLKAVGWEGEINPHTYYIDYDASQIYIGVDPAKHLVEITAHDGALSRVTGPCHGKISDGQGPVIRGLTFTRYAYRALEIEGKEPVGLSDPATYGKDVTNTTLENVTISFCSRVAGYFRGDHLTIRHCLISDTRTEGLYVIGSADVLLEKNIFRRNNIQQMTGYFPAAVKIFNQCYRATCRDNLVIDQPYSNGIWYDVGNVDGVFINNYVENALEGFFFEISKGAICAGNVFVNCDHGVRVLNSSNVRFYHNTLFNSVASFERTERSAVNDHFGWHPSTGPDVDKREGHEFVGNLLVAGADMNQPLLRFTQTMVLCGKLTRPQVKQLDDNVYVRIGDASAKPLVLWSPTDSTNCLTEFKSLDGLRQLHPEFEAHSRYLSNYYGIVFKSPELGNFELVKAFPGPELVDSLPDDIRQWLDWSKADASTPGAYPFHP
ncbi:MAG TPA: right-handed parallel beta-helix repeat-containing protein, partial [Verrucomicrobiae bacterium]|nr:right-handed parallel beta-helix repeat-containing protein [Verrucomicrobiae bacterium]